MLIYLLRHAAVQRHNPRIFLGQSDVPLSPEGLAQARSLAGKLVPLSFGLVASSPLYRALHTAMLASGLGKESIQLITAFQEINLGDWEGLSVPEVQRRYPGAYEARGADLAHFRPPCGESFSDLAKRAWPALHDLAASRVRVGGGPVLLVAHAGVNRVLLARVNGLKLGQIFSIPQEYCALSCLHYKRGRFTCVSAIARSLAQPIPECRGNPF